MTTWRNTTIGKIISLQRGYDLPEYDRIKGDIPVYGSFGITGYHNVAKAKGPGVLVGRSGASFGVVNYSSKDYWPHNAVLFVTDFKGNDERFIYYLLQTADLKNFNSGSAQPSLNRNYIYPITIRIPELEVQRKLAAILSSYDDLIENNTRRIKILEEMAQTIYREWFVEFRAPGVELRKATPEEQKLTGKDVFPKGWEIKELQDVVMFQKGKKPKNVFPTNAEGSIPYLLIDGIENNAWVYTNEADLPKTTEEDVVMVMDGARSGLVFIGVRGAIGSTLGCFKTRDCELLSPFVLYIFLRQRMDEIGSKNVGAAIPHANKAYIFGLNIAIPTGTINQTIHGLMSPMFREVGILKSKNLILRRTRDLLLPKLISGEVVVNEL